MRDTTTVEYQLRAARQRLRGIEAELKDRFSFESIADRADTEKEINRLAKLYRKVQQNEFNEKQFARLQDDLFA